MPSRQGCDWAAQILSALPLGCEEKDFTTGCNSMGDGIERECDEGWNARYGDLPVCAIFAKTGSAGGVRLGGSLCLPAMAQFSRWARLVHPVALWITHFPTGGMSHCRN